MPRQETLVCPSRAELLVRSRKTRDLDVLTSDDPKADDRYVEGVIVQTLKPGPYKETQFMPTGNPRVNGGFLMGDYYAVLLKHHQLNIPDKPFIKTFRCDGDGCGYTKTIRVWMGDESSDGRECEDGIYRMRMRMMKPEVAEQFKEKNLFEIQFGKKAVHFLLQTRASYAKFVQHVKQDKKKDKAVYYTSLLASRIVRVEGVQESFHAIREWLGGLDEDDEDDLTAEFDKYDCGVDTDIFPYCPRCEEEKPFRVDIDKNFFERGRLRRRPTSLL